MTSRQQDKQNLAALERKLLEERKQKASVDQALLSERKAKKAEEAVAARAVALATAARFVNLPLSLALFDALFVAFYQMSNFLHSCNTYQPLVP